MDLLVSIAEKVVVALSASGLSLLGLRLFRPSVEISPEIAVWWSDERQQLRYSIKLVNKSRRILADPRFELVLVYKNSAGRNKSKLIMRERPDPMSIKGRSGTGRSRKNKGEGVSGVYTVTYSEDIIETVGGRTRGDADAAYLRFRCFARDGMSGVGRQFEMKYENLLETIVYGNFERGKGRQVVREQPADRWTDKLAEVFGPGGSAAPEKGRLAVVDSQTPQGTVPSARNEDGARHAAGAPAPGTPASSVPTAHGAGALGDEEELDH
ncbi:hypothetical protein ACFYYH_33795 [Streptomyces sp. NPDC002018]|uniref:hypothetical protein n=1 Tax=Streptomyces sp. NPDC002018 TaxID=3364629 RepID=UPI0036A4FA02